MNPRKLTEAEAVELETLIEEANKRDLSREETLRCLTLEGYNEESAKCLAEYGYPKE